MVRYQYSILLPKDNGVVVEEGIKATRHKGIKPATQELGTLNSELTN